MMICYYNICALNLRLYKYKLNFLFNSFQTQKNIYSHNKEMEKKSENILIKKQEMCPTKNANKKRKAQLVDENIKIRENIFHDKSNQKILLIEKKIQYNIPISTIYFMFTSFSLYFLIDHNKKETFCCLMFKTKRYFNKLIIKIIFTF